MTYYKAVRLEDGKRYSLVIGKRDTFKYRIEYTPNEWIKPAENSGGIYIFKADLDHVRRFAICETSTFEIWECRVKNPREFDFICPYFTEKSFDYFWYDYNNYRKQHIRLPVDFGLDSPQHTYLASSIKLHKLVFS